MAFPLLALLPILAQGAGMASDAAKPKQAGLSPREDPDAASQRPPVSPGFMAPLTRSGGPQSGMGGSAHQDAVGRVDLKPEEAAAITNAQPTTPPSTTTSTTATGGKFADVLGKIAQGAQVGAQVAGSGQGAPPVPPNFGSGARWEGGPPVSGGFLAPQRRATLGDLLQRFRR